VAYRREDYPDDGELPWLDRPDAIETVRARRAAGELTGEEARRLERWVRDGYVVMEGVLDAATAEEINADVQKVVDATSHLPVAEKKKEFENVFGWSAATRRALCCPEVLAWLDLVLEARAVPYQTLNLPVSSQQRAHSDEILMTTHPPGRLIAVWFALEDITDDCGPLIVYPGSHRLPYVGAADVGIPRGVSEDECTRVYDARYYAMIEGLVARHGLEPFVFLPRRGDVLVWHSNLLHGALPVERSDATRKSLIAHYFAEGVEVYSDLFQRACLVTDDVRPARAS